MKFGLMFFASSEDSLKGDKYRLVIESAKFGDKHGFSSVWVPERHFNRFGSLFPNPAVLQAALARETQHIHLRAGSVVLPLHHPLRVVEEWSMVDNLSGGRVGISLASGWNPNDFVFSPEKYENRHDLLVHNLNQIQRLWQGQPFQSKNGLSQSVIQHIYPRPVQKHLPTWMTAAGNPKSFEAGGKLGCHLLTHLLDQSPAELATKIAIYRKARAAAGFDPDTGVVSVMLHTFVGSDKETVRQQTRKPYCDYLKTNAGLLKGLAQSRGENFDLGALSPEDFDQFLGYLYDRFATERGLIGTPETCLPLVQKLKEIGVDEAACLLDFGPETELILDSLQHLQSLHQLSSQSLGDSSNITPSLGDANWIGGDHANQEPLILSDIFPKVEDAGIKPVLLKPQQIDLARIQQAARHEMRAATFYAQLKQWGIQFDAGFQGIRHLWIGDNDSLGLVSFRDDVLEFENGYHFHPAFLDACFQVFVGALFSRLEDRAADSLYLPVGFKNFQAFAPPQADVWSYTQLTRTPDDAETVYEGDIQIIGKDGQILALVTGMRLQRVDGLIAKAPQSSQEEDLYELCWEPKPLGPPTSCDASLGPWLILSDSRGIGSALASQLRARGDICILASPDDSFRKVDACTYRLNPAHGPDIRKCLEMVQTSNTHLRGIIHLWSLDAVSTERATIAGLEVAQILSIGSALELVQNLTRNNATSLPAIWLVTRGSQSFEVHETVSLAQAPLWGWARTLPLEYPRISRTLIDLDPDSSIEASVTMLSEALYSSKNEDQLLVRNQTWHGLRLMPKPLTNPKPFSWRKDGTYLITGGLGSFGMHLATYLVEQDVGRLILCGRSAPNASTAKQLDDFRLKGVDIEVVQGDIGDETTVDALLEAINHKNFPLRGIVHAAGVTGKKLMANMDRNDLWSMFTPKMRGTWLLFNKIRHLDLDFFLMLSSLSPIWGTKGLSHYAAANYFQDAFAYYGRQLGLPTTTVNVGPMGGGGMATADEETRQVLEQMGLRLLTPARVMASLSQILGSNASHRILAEVNWAAFKPIYEGGQNSLLLEYLNEQLKANQPEASAFLSQLQATPVPEHFDLLVEHILGIAARAMKLRGNQLPDPAKGFFDLGMDSLMVLELKTRLQKSLNMQLEATVAFEHATANALATYLLGTLKLQERDVVEEIATEEIQYSEKRTTLAEEMSQLGEAELSALIDEELGSLTP